MELNLFLRENETYDDFYSRCNNLTHFDCSEEEMLWWMMGSRRLPLTEIVPISIVLVVIFLTGVIGNVCVCVVIVRNPGLHTATNYYLFSLAVSDLLLLLFGLPNDLSVYWHQYPYSLGLVFCKLRALISEAATYVSVLTISAFSLERYLAICHPLYLYAMAGLTRASRIILILWFISFLCASPFAVYSEISYRDYPPNSGNMSLNSAFCALMAPSPLLELSSIFFFFVPAVLILCLYVTIALHIRSTKVTKKSKIGLLNGHVHGETKQAKSRKAIIRMLVAVVVAFFVCWTPFHFQRLFYIYGYDLPQFHVINEHLFNVAGALYYVSATVNPILYNVMSARYRTAFHETLLCRKRKRLDSRTLDNTCRDTIEFSTYNKSKYKNRDTRNSIAVNKVDFIKEPSPFCVSEAIKVAETAAYFFSKDEKRVNLNGETINEFN
ncbi:PREDICTED: neuropeptides capa receptor-like [Papilio xuthus]|uniref:Neuropeptides capa receptor-like n=1 Tax=Papilio xuthus TaxID=66420 RepID=A0AAJ6ZFD5_PAPXU|nr:PREDICTED: neuropeptides capa receptor-like [Papilio xuthus]